MQRRANHRFNNDLLRFSWRTQLITMTTFMLSACAVFVPLQASADDHAQLSRLDHLENTLRAQESIRAVKRLQYAYGYYLESGLWSDLADVFNDDAKAEFHIDDQVISLQGKSQLDQYFKTQAGRNALGLAKGQLNQHLLLQPIINVSADGNTVSATWHEMTMLGQFGVSASWAGGIYENEYTLNKGYWKISRLRFYQQYRGGYDEWGHKAPAKWGVPYHFEAAHVGLTIPRSVIDAAAPKSKLTASKRLDNLSARVQRLTDEVAARNLHNVFAYYLDRKHWDDVADLFADNGTFEIAAAGTYVGREHIRHALDVLYGPSPLKTGELFDHINMAAVVTLSSDGVHARVRSTQLNMIGQNGEYARWELGTYENELVKQQGVWKIQAIHFYPRVITHYDAGWAKDAKPAPGPSELFAPDVKPSASYRNYPNEQYVGLHFDNPATGNHTRYPSGAVVKVPLATSATALNAHRSDRVAEVDINQLEQQLDAAVAVDAVENLNSSYGYYIDESAWDQMADTFGSTGSKEITGAGVYVGPDRIRKVLNLRGPRGGRTANFYTIHQLTQPVIHISADGNSANARMRLFQCGGSADGSSASWIGGIYENTAMKENGEWKFGAQELYHNFNASYRNGWARVGKATQNSSSPLGQTENPRDVVGGGIRQGLGGAASGPSISTQMPPDRPIVVRQYGFPEIIEPPFHYANPVTGKSGEGARGKLKQ